MDVRILRKSNDVFFLNERCFCVVFVKNVIVGFIRANKIYLLFFIYFNFGFVLLSHRAIESLTLFLVLILTLAKFHAD